MLEAGEVVGWRQYLRVNPGHISKLTSSALSTPFLFSPQYTLILAASSLYMYVHTLMIHKVMSMPLKLRKFKVGPLRTL